MTVRLIAAATAFSGTVIAGLLAGFVAGKLTGALWLMPVGFFAGLALGVAVIVIALRPIMRAPRP